MAGAAHTPFAACEFDARLQHALRMAKVGAWYMDLVNDNRVWSREVATLIGLPADADLDREVLANAMHPEDRERVRALARRALSLGLGFETDCRVVWPDESVHWVSITAHAHLSSKGEPNAIEGVVADIDERKRLELALHESQRSLDLLVSHLPALVYRCAKGPGARPLFISEGVLPLTGYRAQEVLEGAVMLSDLMPAEDRQRLFDTVKEALAAHRDYELVYRIRRADGEMRYVWDQGGGVYDESGALKYIEGLITDLTDYTRSEQERLRLEARVLQSQKMQALGTLAGGIAHDFNNVLSAIKGNASLASADVPADSPALISIQEIQRSAERASELVRQILAFSRQDPAHRRPISLVAVVAEALRLLRASLPASVEIRTRFEDAFRDVLADRIQIHQVVTNLGLNAAQAIDGQPGWIEVSIEDAELNEAQAAQAMAPRPGRYVRLTVADSGCGMDAETMARIFDPFFTTKPAGQGVGLGLSVVHSIMAAHEGGVAVESEPGAGARFHLYFPLAPTASEPEPREAPQAAPRGVGQRILFVDDEEPLVYLAERFFPRLGYEVTGCMSPEQALSTFRERPHDFDFVVTDLTMPTMSGHDLARELLKIRPDVPIVLASGYLRDEDVEIARAIGVRDVIAKPGTIEDLTRMIHQVLVDGGRKGDDE